MCPLVAAIIRSSVLRGGRRTSDSLGSQSLRCTLAVVVFAAPCSAIRISIGYGPVGRSAASSQATSSAKSSSEATLTKGRNSAIEPPVTGTGNDSIPRERRNRTGGLVMTVQPVGVTSTARQAASQRSR